MSGILKAALCAPGFLYFKPSEEPEATKLSNHGLAERLSYFLTSTMPDDQLRAQADIKWRNPELQRAYEQALAKRRQESAVAAPPGA